MKHFDEIYEIAADGYGIVTASQAREAGVTSGEMRRWCTDGKLVRRGHGVYKVARWVPTPLDPFAEAVALVGDGSFLWGESVLSMHGLALVDPRSVSVATPKRVRRKLPDWVKTVPAPKGASTTFYEGIPSQRVADAIKACEGSVMGERLAEAAKRARAEGLVTSGEYEDLMKELPRRKPRGQTADATSTLPSTGSARARETSRVASKGCLQPRSSGRCCPTGRRRAGTP